jgi:hypothetical protein
MRKRKVEGLGPIKCNKVTQCSNGEIRHEIHPASVDCIDGTLPLGNIAHVRVQNAEINWGVHYCGLGAFILNWCESKVDVLSASQIMLRKRVPETKITRTPMLYK